MSSFLFPEFETKLIKNNGFRRIIGIDEAGRGCWAGPVAVGIYIYDLETEYVEGVADSKKLKLQERNRIHQLLKDHNYEVVFGSIEQIDTIGVGKTIEFIIEQIVDKYAACDTYFIIDGQFSKNFGFNTVKEIKADDRYYSVAAASILAKVERDLLLNELEKEYPEYGFGTHKGYGTKKHREALSKFGVSQIHRRSYIPIKKLL